MVMSCAGDNLIHQRHCFFHLSKNLPFPHRQCNADGENPRTEKADFSMIFTFNTDLSDVQWLSQLFVTLPVPHIITLVTSNENNVTTLKKIHGPLTRLIVWKKFIEGSGTRKKFKS